jgi:hypothetical protein
VGPSRLRAVSYDAGGLRLTVRRHPCSMASRPPAGPHRLTDAFRVSFQRCHAQARPVRCFSRRACAHASPRHLHAQAAAYGACVKAALPSVERGACEAQFAALRTCFFQAVRARHAAKRTCDAQAPRSNAGSRGVVPSFGALAGEDGAQRRMSLAASLPSFSAAAAATPAARCGTHTALHPRADSAAHPRSLRSLPLLRALSQVQP